MLNNDDDSYTAADMQKKSMFLPENSRHSKLILQAFLLRL
jgi:hypothetical protein